jgi:hypothetical protein
MKTLKLFFLTFLLFAVSIVNAQWTTNANVDQNKSGYTITFVGTADSLGGTYATMYSNLFSFDDFDGANTAGFSYKLGAPAGSPKLTIKLIGSNTTTTSASMIVLGTIADSATTTTETFSSLNLTAMHAKYLRLKITSVTTGRANPTFSVWTILPKRDF